MVFLENVKGLVSHKEGKTLNTILATLRKLGYFPHWKVFSSLDFGLPQKRERWYCVAFRKKIDFEFPKPVSRLCFIKYLQGYLERIMSS